MDWLRLHTSTASRHLPLPAHYALPHITAWRPPLRLLSQTPAMNHRQHHRLSKTLLLTAAGCFLLSAPCLLGAVLAHLGVLADVGPAENQQMSRQALRLSVYPLGVGVLLLLAWLVVRRSTPKA